jgi:Protein of unknown function (DUF2934)
MSRESADALKISLLGDPEVQLMIRMRAYEIYQMRGGQPGNPAEDWFRAESEVLSFLIDEESRRASEEAQASIETIAGVELAARLDETADPETSVGAWSVTEPAGMELAPAIGGEAAMATPKKTRTRAASKTTSPRAKKAGGGSTKNTTAPRATSKKTANSAEKPKRIRKKAETPTTQTNEQ